MQQVGYGVAGAPRSLLEAAATTGFKHVPQPVLDKCLKDLDLRPPSRLHLKAGLLINCFKEKWGWNDVDVAKGLRHVMPGAKAAPQRQPTAENVAGRDIPEEVLELMQVVQDNLPQEEAPCPAAAEPAVDDPELPGYGKVEKSLFDALVNPKGHRAAGTETNECYFE